MADDVKNTIGFNDLKILGMLPHDWPNNIERGFDITRAVISNESMSRAKLSLFSEFSDVISDMMSQEPMNCPPMHVRLRSDITIVPRKVSTARRIPLHQEKEADFLVKDLFLHIQSLGGSYHCIYQTRLK